MTLNFSIEYRTSWGQSVEVELCFLSVDGKTHFMRIPLETDDGLSWRGSSMLKARGSRFRYTYIIVQDAAIVRREWEKVERLFPADDARTYFFVDHWRDVPEASYCYTDAFRVSCGIDNRQPAAVALFPRTLLFRIQAPGLRQGERVCLIGDQPALASWDVDRALPMMPSSNAEWLLSVSADGLRLPLEYKYIVVGKGGDIRWEEGNNRLCSVLPSFGVTAGGFCCCLSDGQIRLTMPHWKAAGLVVPLFSLRSEGSQGVGDFGDLKEASDWVASAGMHAIQLLPIYDTIQDRSFTDSYPYNAISVHALHPIYIDLRQVPLRDKRLLASFRKRWQKLNKLSALDYVEVVKLKEEYLHLLYEEELKSQNPKPELQKFAEENAEWLLPYQVFCHLRDTYGTPEFSRWKQLSKYNRSAVTKYAESHNEEVGYYAFVQFLLHQQLMAAAEHARSLRVFLKGDLPIGISPRSVEAWSEPHLFHTDMSAGAPPDDFAREGQNWGFPTYDWERMEADGYRWWRQRLGGMSQYFSAYRIDHILGFFRIWQIPKGSPTALLGQFSPALPMSKEEIQAYGMQFHESLFVADAVQPDRWHPRIAVIGEEAWRALPQAEQNAFLRLYEDFFFRRHNDFWAAQAMKKLPALIAASNMLVCGEDLGMVPQCVGPVMRQLGILSLEIQAMPKAYGVSFARLHENPYYSVDTIFTHDMPTLRLWWKENRDRTQCYYNNVLEHDGTAPSEPFGWLCEEIVAHHLCSPSMLCLISLQDWLSIDESLCNPNIEEERINVPANPKNYWRYRMHIPLSRLREADELNARIRQLIARSER